MTARGRNKTFVERAQFGEVKGTKKVLAGLDWLLGLGDRPQDLSSLVLREHLCQERTPAGKLLRSCLIETGGYAVGIKSKSYVVNAERLLALRQKFNLDPELPSVLSTAPQKIKYLATVKLNPFDSGIAREAGKRVGHRYYSVVTSMEEEVRAALIGHGFDYDIQASMATLLYQRYLQAGGDPLPTWARLVANRTEFRAELASFSGIPVAKIKTIIASILNGAQLVRYSENSVWNIFRVAQAKVTWDEFKSHPLLTGLIEEGRKLYDVLVPPEERTRVKQVRKDGKEISRAKSRGWHQYQVYEQIEDEVMSVVSVVLGSDDVWYIHDGFMCREQLSQEKFRELIKQVKEETGYEIELEMTELRAEQAGSHEGRDQGDR